MATLMEYIFETNNSEVSRHLNVGKLLENQKQNIITEMEDFKIKMKNDVQNTKNNMKAYEKFDKTGRTDFALENSGN